MKRYMGIILACILSSTVWAESPSATVEDFISSATSVLSERHNGYFAISSDDEAVTINLWDESNSSELEKIAEDFGQESNEIGMHLRVNLLDSKDFDVVIEQYFDGDHIISSGNPVDEQKTVQETESQESTQIDESVPENESVPVNEPDQSSSNTGQILFRDIPWETSCDQAAAILEAEDIEMNGPRETDMWSYVDDFMYKDSSELYESEIGCYLYASLQMEDKPVAGYPVDQMHLYFAYLPGEDGLLLRDDQHTALLYAEYKLEIKDAATAYDDLIAKLTTLYGEPESTQHDSFVGLIDDQSLWKGTDDTMVSVVRRLDEDDPSYSEIYIKYGFAGADKLIRDALDALVVGEKVNASNNTDGL